MKNLASTAALAVFLCACANGDAAADACQSVASLTAEVGAYGLTMTVVTEADNAGAVHRAALMYNALPGPHVDAVDALEFITLPDGSLFILLSHEGLACGGLTVQRNKIAAMKQALLGEGA